MTSVSQELPTGEHTAGGFRAASPYGWIVPALVLVLMAVSGWRDGGFWRPEAAAIAVIAAILLVAAVVMSPPDRRSHFAIASLGLVALWWYIRTMTAGAGVGECRVDQIISLHDDLRWQPVQRRTRDVPEFRGCRTWQDCLYADVSRTMLLAQADDLGPLFALQRVEGDHDFSLSSSSSV